MERKAQLKMSRIVRVKKYGPGKDPKTDEPDEVVEFPKKEIKRSDFNNA